MHVRNSLALRSKAVGQAQAVCHPNDLGLRLTLDTTMFSKALKGRGCIEECRARCKYRIGRR